MQYKLSKEQIIQDKIFKAKEEKMEIISNAEALFEFYLKQKTESYRIIRED